MKAIWTLAALALWSPPLSAGAQPADARGAELLGALQRCRGVADGPARLACFDSATARLAAAEQAGEVVVVDRAQVRAARRQAFGFSLPSLDLFDRGNAREPRVDRVELILTGAGRGGDGKWVMRAEGGQVWRQTDDQNLYRPPRAGSRAEVRTGALGSYFMKVDGQKSIRVRREQ